ncbi:MAG: hypothetical protein ABI461_00580 [Polyangiaceae bacterium]
MNERVPSSTTKQELFRGSTVSVGMLSRVLVIVHGKKNPSSEDWVQVCAHIHNNLNVVRGLLVTTSGSAPNAAQRKAGLDLVPKNYEPPPAAVLTTALMVRGVLTALNWFLNDTHRAFRPDNVAGVAAHLKITEKETVDLIAFAKALSPD